MPTRHRPRSPHRHLPGTLAAVAMLLGSGASHAQYTEATAEANATGSTWKIDTRSSQFGATVTSAQANTGFLSPGPGFTATGASSALATARIGSVGVAVTGDAEAATPLTGQPGCDGPMGCIQAAGGQATAMARFMERITIQADQPLRLTFGTYAEGTQTSNIDEPYATIGGGLRQTLVLNGNVSAWEGSFSSPLGAGLRFSAIEVPGGESYIDLTFMAQAWIDVGAHAFGHAPLAQAHGALSYANTFHWAGLYAATDALGRDALDAVTMTAASGYDYKTFMAPVPEPASHWLALLGLACIGSLVRLRGRTSGPRAPWPSLRQGTAPA